MNKKSIIFSVMLLLTPLHNLAYAKTIRSVQSDNKQCSIIYKFDEYQFNNIIKAYKAGKGSDMEYTLAAITIKESNAGLYLVNEKTQDYGLPQMHLSTALKRLNLEPTKSNQKKIANKLVRDSSFALSLAKEEYAYWYDYHNGNATKALASYNAGFNYKKSLDYAYKVNYIKRELRKCI